jgi:hypothetical protein
MNQVGVSPDPGKRGGYALVRISQAAAFLDQPGFRIQRQDERKPFLGLHGWQAAEGTLTPRRCWVEGTDLVLEIGPEVVDAVESGTIGFSLVAGRLSTTVIWPDLPASRLNEQSVFQPPPAATGPLTGAKDAPVRPVLPPPPAAPDPVPPAPPPPVRPIVIEPPALGVGTYPAKKASPWPVLLLLGLGIIVVLAILGGMYVLKRMPALTPAAVTVPAPVPAPTPVPPPPPPTPAADQCMGEPYPQVLQCEKDPAKLYQIGKNQAKLGNMSAAVSLYELSAQGNYGPAALTLAQLYDPATFQPNAAIEVADPAEAAQYYKLATVDGDKDAAAPRAALYNYLQVQKGKGDINAPLTISDYWP